MSWRTVERAAARWRVGVALAEGTVRAAVRALSPARGGGIRGPPVWVLRAGPA
ncbi:hypothetical protein V4890_20600 [Ralstonia solanacearum species complex bacterium KE056]